jgi:hypothetical protein
MASEKIAANKGYFCFIGFRVYREETKIKQFPANKKAWSRQLRQKGGLGKLKKRPGDGNSAKKALKNGHNRIQYIE